MTLRATGSSTNCGLQLAWTERDRLPMASRKRLLTAIVRDMKNGESSYGDFGLMVYVVDVEQGAVPVDSKMRAMARAEGVTISRAIKKGNMRYYLVSVPYKGSDTYVADERDYDGNW